MQLIGRIYEPDVAVLPIGDHYTMGPQEAAVARRAARREALVPCHWGTFRPAHRHARRRSSGSRRGRHDRAARARRLGDGVRERWFGATGRRVPELAVEGELDVTTALVLDDASTLERLREAFDAGTPVVVRAASRRRSRRRSRGRRSRASLVPAGRADLLDARPDRADVRVIVVDVLDRRVRPRRGAVGRRGAVEVPLRRLGRPVGGAGVGAIATQAYANPRYGPDGLALLRDGLERRGGRRAARRRGRRPRTSASSASSTRAGDAASLHGHRVPRLGRPPHRRRATRRRATSSSARRRSTRSRRRSRRRRASTLARRLLECLAAAQAAGGDRRGQQSAALLVVERDGGYAQLSDVAGRPARRRPRAADRGAAPHLRRCTTGSSATTPREEWLPLEGDAPRRGATSGSRASATSTLDAWAGVENLEERVDGERARSTPSSSRRSATRRRGSPPHPRRDVQTECFACRQPLGCARRGPRRFARDRSPRGTHGRWSRRGGATGRSSRRRRLQSPRHAGRQLWKALWTSGWKTLCSGG